jgi:pyruvate/2-oxoglutarate dehydrogenase complex dihydrolipoamide dehydrogenase (E3) component
MAQPLEADLCVIGAGSGGLSVAAGAAQLGRKVVLIERGRMGGDCLNYGCVPSKSLIAAAGMAQAMRSGAPFGIRPVAPEVDFAKVRAHVQDVIAGIAPTDSVERFEGLGVTVIKGAARFTGPAEVAVDGQRIGARRFVVATGSRPAAPPVPGLDRVPYLTNETVFELGVLPERLVVLGGGPIGCELAQAFRRLGAAVTLVDLGPIMPKDDPELTAVVRARLVEEGIELRERVKVLAAEAGPTLVIEADGQRERLTGTHLLVAAGRLPNVEDMGLDKAGVAFDRKGLQVDAGLRTTNRRVYAIGDCAGGLQFTHVAGYHAGIVIRNALFRLPAKAATDAIPWVTYTDPELAAVGLGEAAAKERGIAVEVARWRYAENDRARAERQTEGLVKAIIGKRGRIMGAAIVGARAGDLILPWVIAVGQKMTAATLAGTVVPYPTLGEISKRAAGAWVTPRLFSPWAKRLVGALAWLP